MMKLKWIQQVTMTRAMQTRTRLALALLLALVWASLSGCVVAAIDNALNQGMHDAVYELQDVPTLVFVQLPPEGGELMVGPVHRERIAAAVTYELERNKIVKEVIPMIRVHELSAKMGRTFQEKPPSIHAIGQALGAQQVVIVDVISDRLRSTPGFIEPEVELNVRVIGVSPYKRLFPAHSSVADDPRVQPVGASLTVKMDQVHDSDPDPQQIARIAERLALMVGRDVARMFYRWDERDLAVPGA